MKELLIELFCEEIPAMMQKQAEESYKEIFTKFFNQNKIDFSGLEIFIGPRRITIYTKEVSEFIEAQKTEIKGPKTSAPASAVNGFCNSLNIDHSKLIIQKIKEQDFYFYIEESSAKETKEILLSKLADVISEYVWPKSMYWGDYQVKWVRPLQNILCLFGGEILPFSYGHLTANNLTFGHRFMSDGKSLTITHFEQYKQILQDAFVIIDRSQRVQIIEESILLEEKKLGLKVKPDQALLEEVSGLAEFPVILVGQIDSKFLSVPSEVLVSSMRTHQKYFSLVDKEGNFAPYFLFVSNIKSDNPDIIIQGNQKVLSARLSDALYFYNQDLKIPLENRTDNLKQIVFHAKLGTLADKVLRLENLCKYIAPDDHFASKAALICKSDITSEVVGEFPSLQGIMGYYYAKCQGLNENVARAIQAHYKPLGPSDNVPTESSAILALADKIDSLCGLMLAGEKPTGSKDPYALRRLALGIIRIIITNKLPLNLKKLVEFASNQFANQVQKTDASIAEQILSFLEDRLKHYLKEQYETSLINSIADFNSETDLNIITLKLDIFKNFMQSKEAEDLLIVYKRIANITNNQSIDGQVNADLFNSKYESDLFKILIENRKIIETLAVERKFAEILQILAAMRPVLADFFDNIMVKDTDPKIAENRLLLLGQINQLFTKVANFDHL